MFFYSQMCVFKKTDTQGDNRKHVCQVGTIMVSDYTKKIPVHYFKVDTKHPYRRVVKLRVCMFGTGGKRPNGFIFIQQLCVQAHRLPLALSTGQRTPRSVIHCFLLICMLFSCHSTQLLKVSFVTVVSHLTSEFLVLQMIKLSEHKSKWESCIFSAMFVYPLLMRHLIEF